MTIPDENDLLRDGDLPDDPRADAEPYGPSIEARSPSTPAGWDNPIPLRAVPNPPAFPVEELPDWLGHWVQGQAEALQCPVDLPGVLCLSVLSLAAAKKAVIEIQDGWIEPLNLYLVAALPSGESKSPAFRAAMGPVQAWEIEQQDRLQPTILAEREDREHLEARHDHLKKKAARSKDSEDKDQAIDEAKRIAQDLAERTWTVAPRLVLTDVTPEKLIMLLQAQGGRMAILSDEGGPFDQMAGRYQDGPPNLDVYLQAHSRGTVIVERIGRASSRVDEAALTFGLTVQPEVIRDLRNRPGFRGRGLLARFLFVLPTSRVGRRNADPASLSDSVRALYAARVGSLLDWALPAEAEVLKLDPEGRAVLVSLKAEIEPRIGPGGDLEHLADWMNKLPGAVMRLAGLLHLADEVEHGGPALPRPVSAATVERAVRLGRYFLEHARAAFDLMEESTVVGEARRLLAWMRRRGEVVFSQADAYRDLRATFATPAAMEPAFELLEEYRWVRLLEQPPRSGPGRKPSPVWEVNPASLSDEGRGGQDQGPGPIGEGSVYSVYLLQEGELRNSLKHEEEGSASFPPTSGEADGRERGLGS